MKTKESILWNIPWDKEQKGIVPTEVIYEAMGVYGEQMAIGFAIYLEDNYSDPYEGLCWDRRRGQEPALYIDRGVSKPLSELFQLYIKETQNPLNHGKH